MTELFDDLGIDVEPSDMSLCVSLDEKQGCEWGSRNGLRGLFAQINNAVKPKFWRMLQEINKFKTDVIMYLEGLENNSEMDCTETLGQFFESRTYSEFFQKAYLFPIGTSIWSCPSETVMELSAYSILSFCRDHHLLQLSDGPLWLAVKGSSQRFVNKIRTELEARGNQIRTSCEVNFVSKSDKGCTLFCVDGSEDLYDECIIAVPASDTIKILGKEVIDDEMRILRAFQHVYWNQTAWGALNFKGNTDNIMCLTYWLNVLQNIPGTNLPLFLTINPPHPPENILLKSSTGILVPSVAVMKASCELSNIQGKRGIWFCRACHGYDCSEDGLKAGLSAANAVLRSFAPLARPKQMVFSSKAAAARRYTTNFLKRFISAGCLILLEDGGTVLKFEGSDKGCTWKTTIRVHTPRFYWKVAIEADFGLADAFINKDISVVDSNEGLLNLFRTFLANLYIFPSVSKTEKKSLDFKGWWTSMFFAAGIASAKYFYRHVSQKISVKLLRNNVARHDLARVEEQDEVLEIGCGWGTLAIELVKKTGCRYTGITLAEEQLKYAEQKVKEAGLQSIDCVANRNHIRFLLCDYRKLPATHKYNKIISCEVIEQVGDEYYEDFFRHCDSLLADNGLFVLQMNGMMSTREARREYIFPGGLLPSLSRLTLAMNSASRLCVEHVENTGVHYGQTLRYWWKKFLQNQSKIRTLGFDEKFMRAWEYYFDYMASMFLTRTLGD